MGGEIDMEWQNTEQKADKLENVKYETYLKEM